jgi:hypothetical protein
MLDGETLCEELVELLMIIADAPPPTGTRFVFVGLSANDEPTNSSTPLAPNANAPSRDASEPMAG